MLTTGKEGRIEQKEGKGGGGVWGGRGGGRDQIEITLGEKELSSEIKTRNYKIEKRTQEEYLLVTKRIQSVYECRFKGSNT